MKLWISSRYLSSHTNCHRTATGYTLYSRHLTSFRLRSTHMPRRPIWLTNPQPARKRSFFLLHLHLLPHRPRVLLWLLPEQRNLKHRSYSITDTHSNRLRGLRPALRTNIILRGHRNHKFIFSHPLHWPNTCRMSLRWVLSGQPHTHPILCSSLSPSIRHRRAHTSPPHTTPRNRIKQPPRYPIRLRQNPIPPLLLYKRHPRICTHTNPTCQPSLILPQSSWRSRKLYTSQPPSYTTTYQTRMILPICLRHSPIHPKQTRRCISPGSLRPSPLPHPPTTHIQTTFNDLPSPISNPILNPSRQSSSPNLSGQPTS